MPLKNQLHVPQLIENASVKYQSAEFIGDKLCPVVPVKKENDLYRVYDRQWRVPETKRASKGVAREFNFEFSTASFALERHALKDYVGDDEAEENDQDDLAVDTVENLTEAIYRRRETSVAALYTTTSWSLNVSLASGYDFSSNTTTSNPIPVYDTGSATIVANSGKTPNHGFLTHSAYIAVKNHVSIIDRVKYTSTEIGENIVASLLGIQELLIAKAVYDQSQEGVASSMANYFGNVSFIGWKAPAAGRKTPSCTYMFEKQAPRVRSWRDDERKANAYEVEVCYVPKVVASLTGYLIKGV
jgi:hypothetical protein